MLMPSIDRYMTRQVLTVRADAKVAYAHALMREHQIRHLPVLEDGALVGVISERDLYLVEKLAGPQAELAVEEAMSPAAFTACCSDPVDEVVEGMAQHKYGSVVVLDHGRVAGIFTTVDGMQALADLLRCATA
jgi:acetoin utilization protein AcuB